MSKYLFRTFCPACNNGEIISWCHNSKTCGGARYIDEDLYLHCDKCNDKTFIFNTEFNCGKHDFRKPDSYNVFNALSYLGTFQGVPGDIMKKMMKKAIDYSDYE